MTKDSFILFQEYENVVSRLTDEQAGRLFKIIFEYEKTGIMPECDLLLEVAFLPIKSALDRNRKKYDERCELNKHNGKLGGRPKKEEKPNGLEKNQTVLEKPDNDLDLEHDNEHENERERNHPLKFAAEKELLRSFSDIDPHIPKALERNPHDDITKLQLDVFQKRKQTLVKDTLYPIALRDAYNNLKDQDWFIKSGGLLWLMDLKAGKYNGEQSPIRIAKYMNKKHEPESQPMEFVN